MICIVGAMDIEVKGLIERLSNKYEYNNDPVYHVRGTLHNWEVVVVKSGVGKVNATIATTFILSKFPNINLVVNIGVSGGIKPGIKQGDIVIAEESCQHDFDLTAEGLPKGRLPGMNGITNFPSNRKEIEAMSSILDRLNFPHYQGVIASGDQFINSKELACTLYDIHEAYAVDMETAAISHVCNTFKVSFFALRTMSDNADGTSMQDFNSFVEIASKKSIIAISEFVKERSEPAKEKRKRGSV